MIELNNAENQIVSGGYYYSRACLIGVGSFLLAPGLIAAGLGTALAVVGGTSKAESSSNNPLIQIAIWSTVGVIGGGIALTGGILCGVGLFGSRADRERSYAYNPVGTGYLYIRA